MKKGDDATQFWPLTAGLSRIRYTADVPSIPSPVMLKVPGATWGGGRYRATLAKET